MTMSKHTKYKCESQNHIKLKDILKTNHTDTPATTKAHSGITKTLYYTHTQHIYVQVQFGLSFNYCLKGVCTVKWLVH